MSLHLRARGAHSRIEGVHKAPELRNSALRAADAKVVRRGRAFERADIPVNTKLDDGN
jgi:hypothetical protein